MTDPAGDASDRARSHQATIDSLWDFDDAAGSESRFRAAADGASGLERDILLTQAARAMGVSGRFEEALRLLEAIPTDVTETRIRTLLERGRVMNSSGNSAGARPLFEAAFEGATEAGFEFLAIDALHMLAIVADATEQDALNGRALDLASSAADPRARQWRGSILNNLGWGAFERGDLEGALALFEEAVAERQAQGKMAEVLIARWCVGRTLRELGRTKEALALQLSLADAHRTAGTSDSYVDEEIAALRAQSGGE